MDIDNSAGRKDSELWRTIVLCENVVFSNKSANAKDCNDKMY